MAGLNEKVSQPHENFTSTEKIETVKDVIDQLEKERDEQYPEDFLKWLEKKAPEVFEDLQKIDTNTLPEVHEAIATLDDQLTRWEAENAKPEKPSLDIEVARIYEYLEDVKDPAKKAALEASLDKAVKDYGFAKSYPMYMKQAEANLQTVLKDIKDASKAPAAETPAAPSKESTEAPKRKTSSRSEVLKSFEKNPEAMVKDEDGTLKMLFKRGSAADRYLQIQDAAPDKYKDGTYYLSKEGAEGVYEWNADANPPSFYLSDGKGEFIRNGKDELQRLIIRGGDTINTHKYQDTPTVAAPETYAPADTMSVVWRDETLNPAKVEELIKTLDSKKGEFKNLNDKDLKRDDLISKIDLALASDQLSSTSRQKLESYRGQLDAYELQEDGKRSEKLSAAWEKEFANVAKIVAAAKAQNPNLEFNIESRGPHENNKIITLTDKVSGREAKVKITVWPLGKADYSPKGATMVWDTAREGGKNVMADVLYKKHLPKSYESVDELTRTAIEWVGKVDLKKVDSGVSKAPTSAPIAQQSSERTAEYVSTRSGTEIVADDFVPGEEILIKQPPETDGDYETHTETRPVSSSAEPEEVASEEELVRAGAETDPDTTASTDTVRDEETSPAGEEEIIAAPGAENTEEEDGEASAEPLEAPVYRGATLEEFEAKEAEIRDKYKLDGKITELNRSGEVYSFKYNDTAKVTVNPDGSLTVVKSFPDGKVVSSVIPEDWGTGMDAAINDMQPVAPREETGTKAMDMDALDVPAAASAPEVLKSDIDIAKDKAKTDLGLKGDIDLAGKREIMDGSDKIVAYILKYRGEEIRSIPNPSGNKYILIIEKSPVDDVFQISKKGEVDSLIDKARVKSGPKAEDKYFEKPLEQSAEGLIKKYNLRGTPEKIIASEDMNHNPILEFEYREHKVRVTTKGDKNYVEIRDIGMVVDESKSETIDGEIDFDEKFAPKEYIGANGMVTFISENGGPKSAADRLVSKILNERIDFDDIHITQYHSPNIVDRKGPIEDRIVIEIKGDEMKGRDDILIKGDSVITKNGNSEAAIREAISATNKRFDQIKKEIKKEIKEEAKEED